MGALIGYQEWLDKLHGSNAGKAEESSTSLPNLISDYFQSYEMDISTIKRIVAGLGSDCTEYRFTKLITETDRNYRYRQNKLSEFMKAIGFCRKTFSMFRDTMDNPDSKISGFFTSYVKKYSAMGKQIIMAIDHCDTNTLNDFDRRDLLKYCYYNDDYAEGIWLLLSGYEPAPPMDLVMPFGEAMLRDSKLQKLCYDYLYEHEDSRYYSCVPYFIPCLKPEQRKALYELDYDIFVSPEDIADLSQERQLEMLCRQFVGFELGSELLHNITLPKDVYCVQLAGAYYMLFQHGDYTCQEYALSSMEKLPEARYLMSYICCCMDRQHGYYHRLPRAKKSDACPDFKSLYRYFTPGLAIGMEDGLIEERYVLLPLFTADSRPLPFSANLYDGRTDTFSYIPELDNPVSALMVIENIRLVMKAQYEEQLEAAKQEQREYLKQQKQLMLNRNLTELADSYDNMPVILEESSKADMDFYFSPREDSYGACDLEVKIGIGKKYVVKNMVSFFHAFVVRETVVYGKGFSLTHTPENIAENKREALNTLILYSSAINTENMNSKKELFLTPNITERVIRQLKGCRIFFNGNEYMVTLEELDCPVRIDSDMSMHTDFAEKDYEYLQVGDSLFAFNREQNRVDLINSERELQPLTLMVLEADGISVEPVFEKFRDGVFARYNRHFTVDEGIKDRLAVNCLEINAYFDYEKNRIHVKTQLMKDGKHVTEGNLNLTWDRARLGSYHRCLERLGFKGSVMAGDGDILNFFSMDMSELKKLCNVYLSDSISGKKLQGFSRQQIRIQRSGGMMEAFLDKSEYSDEELNEVIRAIRKKKKYVLLSGDRIVDLTGEEAAEFEQTVTDLGLNPALLSRPGELTVAQALKGFAHEENVRLDDYLYKMIEDIRDFKAADVPVPKTEPAMRPYQEEGFRWLSVLCKYHVGGILADDMGLGKTLEIISLILADKSPAPNLVVCPKSVVFNWINEFRRFAPELEIEEIYGGAGDRRIKLESIKKNKRVTYVTSYDSLRNDIELYSMKFNILVLDEAQYIKNVDAKKSKSVKTIKAEHRLALTGTPIENSVLDLWSIFDFIMPGYLEELDEFRAAYTKDEEFTEQVARRVAPFILRRTKGDVLKDLPDKYERILTVEMGPEQRKLYDAFRMEAREAMAQGGKSFDILPYLMRLRQICDGPSMFVEDYKGGSGKLDMLEELVDSYLAQGHRLLIFSQFVKALGLVEELLNRKGLSYYRITGDTGAQDRIDMMNSFNAGGAVNLFLISLKAGGTGLNLTGADTVIHLDPWWNVAAEDQASDRAHRIGQTRNVEVIKLICENSVEQRVIELQNMKKDLIDRLISSSDSSVTGVTLEDIAFILR